MAAVAITDFFPGQPAMQSQPESIITELELAVRSGTSETRVSTLRQVTDLFLHDSDRLNDEQVKVFDEVLCLLANRIENKALAELSERLAPVDNAPIKVIRRLAQDDEIGVAGPVLADSKRLTTKDLSEIARTHGNAHLLAISGRDRLEEPVTDILVERGNREVVHKLSANTGARFSDTGYGALVRKAEGDDALAERVGQRLDIPINLHRELLSRASESVRSKLLALASPETRDEISRVLATATNAVASETRRPHNFTAAEQLVLAMQSWGALNDAAVFDFAIHGKFGEVTAALAVLCSAPLNVISELVMGARNDAVLIPCKAAGLQWPTVETILRHRHRNQPASAQIVDIARHDFAKLSIMTAQKTLRFLQIRATVSK
jgi:uncharacterized protein (DUF2336 family)